MADKVQVKVKIGTTNTQNVGANERVGEIITNQIINASINKGISTKLVNVDRLKVELPKIVEAEYAKGLNYGITKMMGSLSPRGAGELKSFTTLKDEVDVRYEQGMFRSDNSRINPPRGRIVWGALSGRAIREKMSKGMSLQQARKFYVDTGSLRQKLRSATSSMIRKTGVVKITASAKRNQKTGRFVPRGSVVPLGEINIKLLPKVPMSLLPGVAANNFGVVDHSNGLERFLAPNHEILTKLSGPPNEKYKRHLLQPIFTYWTLFHVPMAVGYSIRRLFSDRH